MLLGHLLFLAGMTPLPLLMMIFCIFRPPLRPSLLAALVRVTGISAWSVYVIGYGLDEHVARHLKATIPATPLMAKLHRFFMCYRQCIRGTVRAFLRTRHELF